ncbi:hypothetical protein P9112_012752 [Eukaryota sp. TZLM1-RC]
MPYHSKWNSYVGTGDASIVYVPVKSDMSGPAPRCDASDEDIVEETLRLFKANVLSKQFNLEGPADRLLIYLTLTTVQFLRRLEKASNQDEANKIMHMVASEEVSLPGSSDFHLNSIFTPPKDESTFRQYFVQLRRKLGSLLVSKVFTVPHEKSKWWMMWSRNEFLGIKVR